MSFSTVKIAVCQCWLFGAIFREAIKKNTVFSSYLNAKSHEGNAIMFLQQVHTGMELFFVCKRR